MQIFMSPPAAAPPPPPPSIPFTFRETHHCCHFHHSHLLLLLTLLSSTLVLAFLLLQWPKPNARKRLPPGSLGWPYIGETLRLYAENPNHFFSNRQKRYGSIFKSHILGCPSVVVSNPEQVKTVLVSQAHLFKPTYPKGKERLIGPEAIFFHQGLYHKTLRKLVQASFSSSALKRSVSEVEAIVLKLLPTLSESSKINTLQEMKRFAFEVAIMSTFGETKDIGIEGIKNLYSLLEKGYNSVPLNFPGTRFRRAMTARKRLSETLRRLIERRRESCKNHKGGLLSIMLGMGLSNCHNENQLSDSQIADNIIGVIFAAHDTTASALTWTLKYLHDNANLLEAVREEQRGIRAKIVKEQRKLRWNDTKCMPLTSRVIQETLRTASILSFTFREAVEDIEFEGYFIPKGWKVLPLFRSIHHSAEFFSQPDKFNPARFEEPPKPNTYMPFGNGLHACPGSELAKLEILILLHHLTINYRWEVVGDDQDGIQYCPFPVPKHGLPVKITSVV